MKYLATTFAIAFMAFGFVSITAILAQAHETPPLDEYGCPDVDSMKANHCRMNAQADRAWEADQEPIEEYPRIFGKVTDVDPLTETAQGGDRDGDVSGDSGSDADRAAASTSAE